MAALAPDEAEVAQAVEVLQAAQAAHWAPTSHRFEGTDTLYDRASYRYFWHLLERAHRSTPGKLPAALRSAWFA